MRPENVLSDEICSMHSVRKNDLCDLSLHMNYVYLLKNLLFVLLADAGAGVIIDGVGPCAYGPSRVPPTDVGVSAIVCCCCFPLFCFTLELSCYYRLLIFRSSIKLR